MPDVLEPLLFKILSTVYIEELPRGESEEVGNPVTLLFWLSAADDVIDDVTGDNTEDDDVMEGDGDNDVTDDDADGESVGDDRADDPAPPGVSVLSFFSFSFLGL